MPNLDIRTLSFLAMIASVVLAAGLQLVNRVIARDLSLRLWAAGAVAAASAYVLFGLRGVVPDLLSIVLGNALLIAGTSCWYLGNRCFGGRGIALRWPWLLCAGAVAALAWFTFVTPSLTARVVIVSAALAPVLAAAAFELLRQREPSNRRVRGFIALFMGATALLMAIRSIATWHSGIAGQDLMVVTAPIHTFTLVFGIALNVALGIGLPLLISERMQRRLVDEERRYRTLYNKTPAIMHSIDQDGYIIAVSDLWVKTFGYPRAEIIGRKSTEFLTEQSRRYAVEQALPQFYGAGSCSEVEFQFVAKGGRVVDVLLSAIAERDSGDGRVRSLAVLNDVTERKQNQRRLDRLMAEQKAMLENDLIGIVKTRDRIIQWANPAFEKMLGYGPGEMIGTPTAQHYPSLEAHAALGAAAYPVLAEGKVFRGQVQHRRKDGSLIWVDVSGSTFDRESGESLWGFLDITELKASAEKIHNLAFFDPLTQLPNRRMLLDRLGLALPKSARRDAHGALLFLDLDNFKQLNDTRGHEFGDLLLVEAARRLLTVVRGEDTVARFGGDEFVLMVEGLSADPRQAVEQAQAIAEKVRDALVHEYSLRSQPHRCTCSVGVSLFKGGAAPAGELLKRADIAMYRAKAAGGNAIHCYATDTEPNGT